MASCPKHKGIFPFVEGDESTTFYGHALVLEGHKLACGCHAFSTIAPTFTVHPTNPQILGAAASSSALHNVASIGSDLAARLVSGTTEGRAFSGRFQLLDESTGSPVAGRRVRLRTTSRETAETTRRLASSYWKRKMQHEWCRYTRDWRDVDFRSNQYSIHKRAKPAG